MWHVCTISIYISRGPRRCLFRLLGHLLGPQNVGRTTSIDSHALFVSMPSLTKTLNASPESHGALKKTMKKLHYVLYSGKPIKLFYFIREFLKLLIPRVYYRKRLRKELDGWEDRADATYIAERVNYYCRLNEQTKLPSELIIHKKHPGYFYFLDKINRFRISTFHKAYYFDLWDVARYFPSDCRVCYIPGDVYFTPEHPALVKSRLLTSDNQNSVLLKLDKLRHFIFLNDSIEYVHKMDKAIFRGKIRSSRLREKFLHIYFGSSICDCGIVGSDQRFPAEWQVERKTIQEHLSYKFIIALEGNDVASNLKWVMSSNSIAVMTRPTCETWFMEGCLKPNYHYIEIRDDLSDLQEKLEYYASHIDEAHAIINHAHEYVAQFMDERRERLIQLLVMDKYLKIVNGDSGLANL